MAQENKSLLLQELLTRLSYGVKVTWDGKHSLTVTPYIYCAIINEDNIDKLPKIFLRPISSITKDEKKEAHRLFTVLYDRNDVICGIQINTFVQLDKVIEWLNKHHFDWRGLIDKGLAIEAPEGMYTLKEK